MKKYLSLIAFFAVAAIACNKVDEPQISDQENELVANTNLVSFSVNLPDFVNTDTKASISDAGAFSWAENDAIFVLCCKEDDNTFHQVPFVYNTTNGKFECSFPASVTYPGGSSTITINGITRVATPEEATADGRPIAVYPDPLALVTEPTYSNAQKFFKMEGSLNSTTGEIDFEHKSALVNVHIANVPNFASYFTVSGGTDLVTVHFSGETPAEVNKTVPITPTGSASDVIITLYDTADNVIISKRKSGKTLVAGHLYDTPQIKVGPVIDIKKFATSWEKAYIYLFDSDYLGTPWADLGDVVKSYNDGANDHYYRILPGEALGNTYGLIVFNSADDTYRIRTSITIENQNYYSASQKEGLRKVGDDSYRFILRDEPLGTDKDSNPDTYLYIKSITGVDGSGFTGSWESDETKALGWFIGKRSGSASGRYYYFDIDALKSYAGSRFVYEYTMYKEGDHTDRWRGVYDVSYESSGISNYIHVGYYSNTGGSGMYIDNDFDSQMSE